MTRWQLALVLLTCAALPRALVYPLNENVFGDSVARTELALQWAASPRWMSGHDDAYQFGPLHLYMVGGALLAGLSKEHAGRAVSLVFGVATVLPLFWLTRRLFDRRAAWLAAGAFSVWGIHLQLSTTAASESLSLFLTVAALACFAEARVQSRPRWLIPAALALTLAAATRYDAWLLAALLPAAWVLGGGRRSHAALFALGAAAFPISWAWAQADATGDPLAPIHMVDAFHRAWAIEEMARLGPWLFRLQGLLFWPLVGLATLGPGVLALSGLGLYQSVTKRQHLWLAAVVLVPMAYFTVRSTLVGDFVPLARFTVAQLVLLLPFFAAQAMALAEDIRSRAIVASLASVAALSAVVAVATWDPIARSLGPISPISRNPVEWRAAAEALKAERSAGPVLAILDEDGRYGDLQVGFYSGLSESELVRARWGKTDKRLAGRTPTHFVTCTRPFERLEAFGHWFEPWLKAERCAVFRWVPPPPKPGMPRAVSHTG